MSITPPVTELTNTPADANKVEVAEPMTVTMGNPSDEGLEQDLANASKEPIIAPPAQGVQNDSMAQMRKDLDGFRKHVAYLFEKVAKEYMFMSVANMSPEAIAAEAKEGDTTPKTKAQLKLHVDMPRIDASKLPTVAYISEIEIVFATLPITSPLESGLVFHRNGTVYVGDPFKTEDKMMARIVDHLSDDSRAKDDVCRRLPYWNGIEQGEGTPVVEGLVGEFDLARREASIDVLKKAFIQYAGWKTITISRTHISQGHDIEVLNPHAGVVIIHKFANPAPLDMADVTYYLTEPGLARQIAKIYLPTGLGFSPIVIHRHDLFK